MFASFYLERSECDAGAGSWGAISDCGLSSVCHALLLQRPLLSATKHYRDLKDWEKNQTAFSQCCSETKMNVPGEIWRFWPSWPRWLEPAWLARCRSSPADPGWSPDPPDTHRLQSAAPHQKLRRNSHCLNNIQRCAKFQSNSIRGTFFLH